MQSSTILRVLAAMAVIAPGTAFAQSAQKPVTDWRCEGDRCVVQVKASADDLLRQCRRVVRVTGPVSEFRVGGRELSAAEISACNRFVIMTQAPRD